MIIRDITKIVMVSVIKRVVPFFSIVIYVRIMGITAIIGLNW